MTKKNIAVSIDEDLHKKAQKAGLNISGILESALRSKFISCETDIPKEEGEKCHECGIILKKVSRDDLNGLTWLWPDEIWICNSCLETKKRRIVKIAQ